MYQLRAFSAEDAQQLNSLAISAFAQYRADFNDWPALQAQLNRYEKLARSAEVIVALDSNSKIVGSVAYVSASTAKADYFPVDTPLIRMLVVDPSARGLGIGRALSDACVERAREDRCRSIALHTSAIMTIALGMYLRMGFVEHSEAPDLLGVEYKVYVKHLY